MEDSVGPTIEKIKLLEQDKEAKLKEKREIEAAFASLSRAIREKTTQAEKSEEVQKVITNNVTVLSAQIMIEKIHRDALINQLHIFNKELEDLRAKSNDGISTVWQHRSKFCKEIFTTSDNYDIWALLVKPAPTVLLVEPVRKQEETEPNLENENRLQTAIQRRENALKDRDLLKTEPDNGDEFIRYQRKEILITYKKCATLFSRKD